MGRFDLDFTKQSLGLLVIQRGETKAAGYFQGIIAKKKSCFALIVLHSLNESSHPNLAGNVFIVLLQIISGHT